MGRDKEHHQDFSPRRRQGVSAPGCGIVRVHKIGRSGDGRCGFTPSLIVSKKTEMASRILLG